MRNVLGRAVNVVIDADINEAALTVYSTAHECDRLQASLVEAAKSMADRFREYADRVGDQHDREPPTGYSTLRDIDRDSTRLSAKREELWTLVRVLYGQDGVRKVRDEVKRLLDEHAAWLVSQGRVS